MKIKFTEILQLNVNDDDLVSWSYERFTGIYTFTFKDNSVWKYESKEKRFYMI